MSRDSWYQKTEPIFRKQPLKTEKDLTILVALAYSWMPTIPKMNSGLNWQDCEKALSNLKEKEECALKEIMELLVPIINNSIVGTSKALHFVYPTQVPIIDSNVVAAWRSLFFDNNLRSKNESRIVPLPQAFGSYGNRDNERKKHIALYVNYSENLNKWSKEAGVPISNIEEKLFLFGKELIAKKLEAKKLKKRQLAQSKTPRTFS